MVNVLGAADFTSFLNSAVGKQLIAEGSVVGTRLLDERERHDLLQEPRIQALFEGVRGEMVLEHERIAFPSFPYEWPPEMLHAAATLTLDLANRLLPEGFGVKDATPYNVLFRGPNPIFVDVLSLERRAAGDAVWLPYAQLVRTFLLPLLANRDLGLALDQALLARRDGLEPDEVYSWISPFQRLKPLYLSLVSMPTWLGRRHNVDDPGIYRKKTLSDPEKAVFVLRSFLRGLTRTVAKLKPASGKTSAWSNYCTSNNNYSSEGAESKKAFVEQAMAEFRPKRVLDIGCNTGLFSAIAAQSGASVVAIDCDPAVLGEVWRTARDRSLDILPLVVNIARPTPGTGWLNSECPSFLDRARGRFDAVLMLAVVHHLIVTERVPLPQIVDLAASLTSDLLVIEFVAPEDSMFHRLTRGRDHLHQGLDAAAFEDACHRRFDTVRVSHIDGTWRWLYTFRKRP